MEKDYPYASVWSMFKASSPIASVKGVNFHSPTPVSSRACNAEKCLRNRSTHTLFQAGVFLLKLSLTEQIRLNRLRSHRQNTVKALRSVATRLALLCPILPDTQVSKDL